MSAFEYEGDTGDINEKQLKFIEETLEKRGYKNNKVLFEVVGEAGDNYMANVKRITVHDEDKVFRLIAKIAPSNETMRTNANTHKVFCNEHIMYTEVLPKFKNIQHAAQVSKEDLFRFAECYGSYAEAPNEVILLEDLKESSFVMLNRFESLNDECVKSVLRSFAILHSLSFALKNKEPQLFEEFANKLSDAWVSMGDNKEIKMYFGFLESHVLKLVSDNEKNVNVIKQADISNIGSSVSKLTKLDSRSKHNVIIQGDSWTNNIMFKYDDKTLVESIMIDYQISKVAKPVCDLLYMIFNCTDHRMRVNHYHDWIDYYHKELDKALSNYGLKANYIYPKDQLDVDLKRYGKNMLALCVILSNALTTNSEDAAKMKENMNSPETFDMTQVADQLDAMKNQKILKARVEGLISSFVEFGLI